MARSDTTTTTNVTRRELAHRFEDGLDVTLFWHPRTNTITVLVVDERTGESFEFGADPARALDAFEHPFAYGDAPAGVGVLAA